MSGFHGMDFDERIKPFAQQVALLDQQRMEQIADLKRQLAGAVDALREAREIIANRNMRSELRTVYSMRALDTAILAAHWGQSETALGTDEEDRSDG